jgi:hypothetical protein
MGEGRVSVRAAAADNRVLAWTSKDFTPTHRRRLTYSKVFPATVFDNGSCSNLSFAWQKTFLHFTIGGVLTAFIMHMAINRDVFYAKEVTCIDHE